MTEPAQQSERTQGFFRLLMIGFVAQIAGRLVDLQWHTTHEEFEGGVEQLQAHWLIWIATLFITGVAGLGSRQTADQSQRRAYLVVLLANLAYGVVAVIHFFQHLNQPEVDWTHILLAVTNIVAVAGVLWVIATRVRTRPA